MTGTSDDVDVPAWVETSPSRYVVRHVDGEVVVCFPSSARPVKWRSGCDTCQQYGSSGNDFFPSHDAMSHCRSGRRPHCTCDGCF